VLIVGWCSFLKISFHNEHPTNCFIFNTLPEQLLVTRTHLTLGDFDVLRMINSLANWTLWSLYNTHIPVKISNARDKFKRVKTQSVKCVCVTSGHSSYIIQPRSSATPAGLYEIPI